jgi:hypothetical protein
VTGGDALRTGKSDFTATRTTTKPVSVVPVFLASCGGGVGANVGRLATAACVFKSRGSV